MRLIKWKPSFSLGIPEVDREHRELIGLINMVYASMASARPEIIETCLADIYAGISSHFVLEERHMRDTDFAEYAAHKQDHQALLDQIRVMMERFNEDPEAGSKALQRELSDWFSIHFTTFDARLHRQLGA